MPVQMLAKKMSEKSIPILKTHTSSKHSKVSKDGAENSSTDLHQWFKRKQSMWQSDGNPFAFDKEQMEEIVLILTANNFPISENLVDFCFKEKSFIPRLKTEPNIRLLNVEGFKLHIETQKARKQLAEFESVSEAETWNKKYEIANDLSDTITADDEETGDEAGEDENKYDRLDDKKDNYRTPRLNQTKKLMNQFNFCERATTTYENTSTEQETKTKPLLRTIFSDYVSPWIIYDTYQEDYKLQKKGRGKKEKTSIMGKILEFRKNTTKYQKDVLSANMRKKIMILERMINQNMFKDVLQDFRYYEDSSDEFRNKEGTLLPLWKFQFYNSKKLSVTDIKWNPDYFDLLAVSFGCFDFQKRSTTGGFCLWSLKNPSIPEYVTHTTNGVMTLAFHPTRAYLLAIGMYDGIVAVYDFRCTNKSAIYESNHLNNKHTGTVCQVQWCEDLTEGEITFYSISSDGCVSNWILMQNQLLQTSIISLFPVLNADDFKNDNRKSIRESGTCISLHPTDHSIFLIGTEEGYIYKCSTAFLSMYLFVYEAHHMPVYCLDYNKYSTNIFVSCSADWTIKIWEDERKEPLFIFDMTSSVEDVKWAPYSSTVLAAVTFDCKTYMFDLNVDKYKPICAQTISSKKVNSLTKLEFNLKIPILIIGDNRGSISTFKLSPNLRTKPKLTKKQQGTDLREIEIIKLDKLLSLIREPTDMKNYNSTSNTDSSNI